MRSDVRREMPQAIGNPRGLRAGYAPAFRATWRCSASWALRPAIGALTLLWEASDPPGWIPGHSEEEQYDGVEGAA